MKRIAALGLLLCLLWACGPRAPIKVGFVSGLSGSAADLAVEGRNGALLAVETLNAAGAQRFELLVEDDQQSPQRLGEALQSLAARGAQWVVGPMTSAMAVAAMPELERLKLVAISPTATSHELSGRKDHFFRIATDAPQSARQLSQVLYQRGLRRVAVLMDMRNRAYTESFGLALVAQLRELGAPAPAELRYESGPGLDYAALAERLLATQPEAVVLVNSAPEAALTAQALRRIRPALQLAVSPWGANKSLLEYGGRAIEGALVLQALDLDDESPAFVDFKKRYQARFGDPPGTAAVQSYDSLMLGAQAWRARAGAQSLREVLGEAGRRWTLLQGPLQLDAHGDTDRRLHLSEARAGRLQGLRP
ncbi:ABC transporter substrate-binding protein [Paucibacter sp. XJ19-41]|uniref:ABC transporter substrate-binding protein n=1 Tax=Paucibacter sp. XJ19-41 TaxID=2927824 RepID=UPI00234C02C3|nr:ABC transporter substrate-binding protein [Paucibacter sp. XJ19-41]MDC6166147.1 ABC transporter substrate-binding protein [Paucibacter sp. XJ19-41]